MYRTMLHVYKMFIVHVHVGRVRYRSQEVNGSGSDQEEGVVVCLYGSLFNSIGHSLDGHRNE